MWCRYSANAQWQNIICIGLGEAEIKDLGKFVIFIIEKPLTEVCLISK